MVFAAGVYIRLQSVAQSIQGIRLHQLGITGLDVVGIHKGIVRPDEGLCTRLVIDIFTVENSSAGDFRTRTCSGGYRDKGDFLVVIGIAHAPGAEDFRGGPLGATSPKSTS